jgi:hypothetical protein
MKYNFSIRTLGERHIKSPLNIGNFTQDKKDYCLIPIQMTIHR